MTFYSQASIPAKVVITTVFTLLVLIGVIGNILSCIVILTNRSMKTPMNYLILNLAVADIIVVAFVSPRFILIHAFDHPDGVLGSVICKIFTGSNFSWFGGSASVYSLVAISVERYFSIVHPYSNKGKLTMKKLKYVIIACWTFAVIFNAPLFIAMRYNKEINFCTEDWYKVWIGMTYSFSWLVLCGLVPIGIMFPLYWRVIRRLWIHPVVQPSQVAILKSRKRVTKMVIAVSAIYSITWFPVLVVYMLNYWYEAQDYGNVTYIIAIVIVTFNSCVNPFVYAFINERYRMHLKRLFRLPSCLKRNQIQPERRMDNEEGDNNNTPQQQDDGL